MKGLGVLGLVGLGILLIGIWADIRTGRPITFDTGDLTTAAWTTICLVIGAIGLYREAN